MNSGRTDFSFAFGGSAQAKRVAPEGPFRLAVLGDFSGRGSRGIREPLESRKVLAVDSDNVAQVQERFGAKLILPRLAENEGPLTLTFASVEDFHPDRLLSKLSDAGRLLRLRREMSQPASAGAAAAELRSLLRAHHGSESPPAKTKDKLETRPTAESDADTMSRLLGGTPERTAGASRPTGGPDLSGLFRQAAQASGVPAPSSEEDALGSMAELQIQQTLRRVLHAAAFQELEGAWRSLDMLVRRFGGDERIRLLVLDCTKEEIAADPQGFAKVLVRSSEQGGWAAWLGLFHFGTAETDFTLLTQIATMAAHLRAPFLSHAEPALAGCADFPRHPYPEEWKPLPAPTADLLDALRQLPEANWVGLAMPRFMLRQPYGKGSDQIESFAFEEMSSPPAHEDYLWGNPAVLCGFLLGDAFLENGWEMDLNAAGRIENLPVHRFREEGETVMKPCAEAWLSDRAGEALLARGFIPMLSVKNSDSVQVYKVRSLAAKAGLLAGPWS